MEKLIIPSILLVTDLVLLSERILEITRPLIGGDDKVTNLHANLTLIYERLVDNQKNAGKNLFEEELGVLDKRRSRALFELRDVVQGMSVALLNEMSSKASDLIAIIDKYCPEAYQPGFKVETSMLISFIYEFDLPAIQALLTDLHIIHLYQSLKGAQTTYDEINQQRSEEIKKRVNESESTTQIQEEIIPALISLTTTIQFYYHLDPAKYGFMFNQMTTFILEVNANARSRQSRRQRIGENPFVQQTEPLI
jgi:hypothetical protein